MVVDILVSNAPALLEEPPELRGILGIDEIRGDDYIQHILEKSWLRVLGIGFMEDIRSLPQLDPRLKAPDLLQRYHQQPPGPL